MPHHSHNKPYHHPCPETSLEHIELLGQMRKQENQDFRDFLRGKNARKIDMLVHQLDKEVTPKIDCTTCGNCCKHLSPCLTKEDLRNLSTGLNMPPEEVIEKYTETDANGLSLKALPCTFLKENKCTIYQHRPSPCSSFPHLSGEHVTTRLRNIFDNYSICPIIFNVIELMKIELEFKSEE